MTQVPRIFYICKITEQVRTISVPDLIALYHWIIFQLSTNSLLFSAHINSSAKNFFLLFYIFLTKNATLNRISVNYFSFQSWRKFIYF